MELKNQELNAQIWAKMNFAQKSGSVTFPNFIQKTEKTNGPILRKTLH